jgi:hypothetical protein
VHATRADTSEGTELALRNAAFEELGRMTVPWVPTHLAVTESHVVAASEGSVLVWDINIGLFHWDVTCANLWACKGPSMMRCVMQLQRWSNSQEC